MKPYLFWELMTLVAGIWVLVVVFVIYGWLLLKRQKQMMNQLLHPSPEVKETKIPDEPKEEQKTDEVKPTRLEIARDEPMAKYENFVPEEGVDIAFVDKKE